MEVIRAGDLMPRLGPPSGTGTGGQALRILRTQTGMPACCDVIFAADPASRRLSLPCRA